MNELSRTTLVKLIRFLNDERIVPPLKFGTRQSKQDLINQLKRYFKWTLQEDSEEFPEFLYLHPLIVAPAFRFDFLEGFWEMLDPNGKPPLHNRYPEVVLDFKGK